MNQQKNNLWQLRELGLVIPEDSLDWSRAATTKDIDYLLDQYPFLEILRIEPDDEEILNTPEIYPAENSGWKMHYLGDRIKSSPGVKLFGKGAPDDDSESGSGTVVQQAVDTACAMIWLAKLKNWLACEIESGHPLMQWAAWVAAEELGLKLENYVPSDDDRKRRERVKRELRVLTHRFSDGRSYRYRPG